MVNKSNTSNKPQIRDLTQLLPSDQLKILNSIAKENVEVLLDQQLNGDIFVEINELVPGEDFDNKKLHTTRFKISKSSIDPTKQIAIK